MKSNQALASFINANFGLGRRANAAAWFLLAWPLGARETGNKSSQAIFGAVPLGQIELIEVTIELGQCRARVVPDHRCASGIASNRPGYRRSGWKADFPTRTPGSELRAVEPYSSSRPASNTPASVPTSRRSTRDVHNLCSLSDGILAASRTTCRSNPNGTISRAWLFCLSPWPERRGRHQAVPASRARARPVVR